MFSKKKAVQAADIDTPNTIIGKGVYLEAARMSGQESVRIQGMFKGNLDIDGSLVLEETGVITGNVNANYFLVQGEVNGNIKCSTQLHLGNTSKVEGDVQAPSLMVDAGCQFSGSYMVGANKPGMLSDQVEVLHITEDSGRNDE